MLLCCESLMKVLTKTATDETTVAMLSSTKTQINKPQHWRIPGGGLGGLQPHLWEVFFFVVFFFVWLPMSIPFSYQK